ncbi:precorrin-2 C(20)-methyltransferase [Sedimentitalea todarodis]|uniref:Precorrin-2 C(20)-methyltransferase n=1 Tax=Sedimentitalea todarodis TaxID=1631240 RepID=A0ABU3VHP7_9RHOB|nr:precorrin-2 C(20)-methyltransferase [Sedimentitalea todarodis]MDU9005697.1 precorrin-2 C(20)-methyltransferase [Sedimentitalea todarodis]
MTSGTIYGVGLGPGDPDLMSVRADRLLRNARHVAYFRKAGHVGQARAIAGALLPAEATEFPMEYPVTTEIPLSDPRYNQLLSEFYASCTGHLRSLSLKGEDVVVLCEGDPFFYGSFMHLHSRLHGKVPISVVPAVTGMSGAWTATGTPITWGDDVLTVLMGTLPEDALVRHMRDTDALVVMKIGRNFDKVCRALARSGLADRAWLVERAAMPDQTITPLSDVRNQVAPYFSIILVHGQGRRP